MKRKIVVMSLLALCLIISAVSPASAWVGVADTKAEAIPLLANQIFTYNLSSSTDVDWFSYTNNTGVGKYVRPFVSSTNSAINYDLYGEYTVPGWNFLIPIHATDQGSGAADSFGIGVEPGATLYFRVSGHGPTDYSTTSSYQTYVLID